MPLLLFNEITQTQLHYHASVHNYLFAKKENAIHFLDFALTLTNTPKDIETMRLLRKNLIDNPFPSVRFYPTEYGLKVVIDQSDTFFLKMLSLDMRFKI